MAEQRRRVVCPEWWLREFWRQKPRLKHALVLLQTAWKHKSRNPRIPAIYRLDSSCFSGQGFSLQQFQRQDLFFRTFLLAGLDEQSYHCGRTRSGHQFKGNTNFRKFGTFLFQTKGFFACESPTKVSLSIVRADRSETKWRKADGCNMLKRINSPSSDALIFWCGHIQNWCLNVSWAQFAAFQSCLCVLNSAGLKVRTFAKYLNPMIHFANIHFYLKRYSFILFHW